MYGKMNNTSKYYFTVKPVMYVSMDFIEGNTTVGHGINGTLMGAVSPVAEGKKGQAVRIYDASNLGHIYFGHHPDTCFGNIQLCPGLTIALWLKLEGNGWTGIFTNNGGLRFYMIKSADKIYIDLYCSTQVYKIKVYVPDIPNPAGWIHCMTSCSLNKGNVFVNGKEYFGSTASTVSVTSGEVVLGMDSASYAKPFLADELMVWYKPLSKTCAFFVYNYYIEWSAL